MSVNNLEVPNGYSISELKKHPMVVINELSNNTGKGFVFKNSKPVAVLLTLDEYKKLIGDDKCDE